jgi:hypothetical protein
MGQGNQDIMQSGVARLMCRVAPSEQVLLNCVEYAARAHERPTRPLHLQALLQLPRLANAHGLVPIRQVDSLLTELAQELPRKSEWLVGDASLSPRLLHFRNVDHERACDIVQRFHYLQSPRTDGRAYGLITGSGKLVALCVSSPLDVATLRELLHSHGRKIEFARVLSRVFAFEGAPKNSISYMLSRAAMEERQLGVTDFITYVNPNMGFTGSSYRASGWQLFGREDTEYRYVDGRYITDRELRARFGSRADGEYERLLGERFVVSAMPLEPLLVFHANLGRSSQRSTKRGHERRNGHDSQG